MTCCEGVVERGLVVEASSGHLYRVQGPRLQTFAQIVTVLPMLVRMPALLVLDGRCNSL